ncbi:3680_t:CDS:2 [Entrophospora sp. SA101]|nr:12291_t:CDS:2 [Entrophospora sp. SA101]CAJ0639630.1 1967_t:CDS:2 [Entrophospora sp. SA101]CAJ0750934.1 3680_t:CDS:2 [Entrophospora sp. SA101]CAJ0853148.1 12349_t:CDS:2 [Entrophospora sp. SA101]CAJ0906425.1 11179_t:CDS:2 [Entrophospora sp. SA101]
MTLCRNKTSIMQSTADSLSLGDRYPKEKCASFHAILETIVTYLANIDLNQYHLKQFVAWIL